MHLNVQFFIHQGNVNQYYAEIPHPYRNGCHEKNRGQVLVRTWVTGVTELGGGAGPFTIAEKVNY